MFTRRSILQAAAGLAVLSVSGTAAFADWKEQYPEIIIAAVPDENATGIEKRYEPFIQYLSKQLGVPVKLRIANDYAAVIEGQIAGNIHIAQYGPAAYARAYMNGAKIEPFGMQVNKDGTKGYYSVLWVKKDAPYQKLEDLKGKNLGLVDPNSTSGNNVPRFAMNKMGNQARGILRQRRLYRQPRKRDHRAPAGPGRRRLQLVERRERIDAAPHGTQGHGEVRRLPHGVQVGPDRELAGRDALHPAR